jgi:hypothetical protein
MKLAEDQNKHYGFLGKTLRFPPGHPEHGMLMFLIYILVSELAPAVEVPVSVVKKAPAKRSASLAEAQINKEVWHLVKYLRFSLNGSRVK